VDKIELNLYYNVESIQIQEDIHIELCDYDNQSNGFVNRHAARIRETIDLYCAKRKTIREIADILNISKSQVHKDLTTYKGEVLQGIQRDVKQNKLALGLLFDLTAQVDNRIRLLWQKYEYLDKSLQVLGASLEKAHIRLQNNPNARLKMNVLKETARETRIIINTQFNILIQLRGETQQLLNIYDRFGLTSIDAMGLSTGGEGYLQEKIKEIKENYYRLNTNNQRRNSG